MLNAVWLSLMVLSLIFGIFTGNLDRVSASVTEGSKEAITLLLSITGIMCFWSGLMEILIKSGLAFKISKVFSPFLSILFTTKDKKTRELIASNFTANLLGLSNAATPLGLEASKRLKNPHDFKMLVIINSASIQLIPTTVAAIRASNSAKNPFDIIIPAFLTSIISLSASIFLAKLIKRWW